MLGIAVGLWQQTGSPGLLNKQRPCVSFGVQEPGVRDTEQEVHAGQHGPGLDPGQNSMDANTNLKLGVCTFHEA